MKYLKVKFYDACNFLPYSSGKKIQQEANSTGCYQLLELSDRYMGVHCTFKVSAQRMSWPD